jgi:membrane protease YdiL (CAAX protease family)
MDAPIPGSGKSPSRALGAVELLLGAAVVVGHNVYRVVPNEVLILFLVGLLSIRWRSRGLPAIGLVRPASWRRVWAVALAAAATRILVGEYVLLPITSRYWPEPVAPAGTSEITGNLPVALLVLGLVWTFAAFGEEVVYRGWLMLRAAESGGDTRPAWWAAALVSAVLFGVGHWYKGPAGVIDSGAAGLILAAAFLATGRNLWAPILAHGTIDTFGVIVVFFGWDS